MKKQLRYIPYILVLGLLLASCNEKQATQPLLLKNKNKNGIVLYEDSNCEKKITKYEIKELPTFVPYSIKSLPKHDILDSDLFNYSRGIDNDINGNKSLEYLKVTFFVKNESNKEQDYNVRFYISEEKGVSVKVTEEITKDYHLSDDLFFLIYSNDNNDDNHNYDLFNKHHKQISIKQFSGEPEKYDSLSFESDKVITSFACQKIPPNNIRRFTFVTWIDNGTSTQLKPLLYYSEDIKFLIEIE